MKLTLKNLSHYLFYALLVLLPLNARYIFNFEDIKQLEGFREHLTWSIYAFDLVFFFLVASWGLFILQYLVNGHPSEFRGNRILVVFFISTILASALLSPERHSAIYQAGRVIQSVLFFLISASLLGDSAARSKAVFFIFAGGILQSAIALAQFIIQRSVGLQRLGESLIAPDILGVAKIEVAGEKFIRAYGTFPHPNLLGAFLLFSLAAGIWLIARRKKNRTAFVDKYARSPIFLSLGIFFIMVGIFLTFSRSAWIISSYLVIISIIRERKYACVLVSKLRRLPIIFTAIILLICLALSFRFLSARLCVKNCANDKSFELRAIYNRAAIGFIFEKPLLGVGPGNFIPSLDKYPVMWINNKMTSPSYFLQPWEHQPAHNLYLLIASEAGLIGLALFVSLVYSSLRLLPNDILSWTFIGFLLLGMFDHYFWTLPQGQWLLWLGLAMAATAGQNTMTNDVSGASD